MRIMAIFGKNRDKEITSFSAVTLRLSGMRGAREYEVMMKNGEAEVSEYEIRFSQGEDLRVLMRRAECGADEMLALLNRCALLSWDGFRGAHPKGVRDGIQFTLTASVNEGRTLRAEGSENFPKHFRDFRDGLYAFLNTAQT